LAPNDPFARVSLGIVAGDEFDPLAPCLLRYEMLVPQAVIEALDKIASSDVRG
jgi:hypothetical protein